jgi:5-methylcytosine-specific restriction endonuclease McrA
LKQSALKPNPEKVREWQRRSRAPLKQTPRKRRETLSAKVRRDVYARSNRKCVVCKRRRALTIHHVLPVQAFPHLELEPRNMVGACFDCHMNHEAASRRIRWDELPECAVTLAYATSGAAAIFLERTYPR